MKTPPPLPPPKTARVLDHVWVPRRVGVKHLFVCDLCLSVKRADGQNKPCKGRVGLSVWR